MCWCGYWLGRASNIGAQFGKQLSKQAGGEEGRKVKLLEVGSSLGGLDYYTCYPTVDVHAIR